MKNLILTTVLASLFANNASGENWTAVKDFVLNQDSVRGNARLLKGGRKADKKTAAPKKKAAAKKKSSSKKSSSKKKSSKSKKSKIKLGKSSSRTTISLSTSRSSFGNSARCRRAYDQGMKECKYLEGKSKKSKKSKKKDKKKKKDKEKKKDKKKKDKKKLRRL
jgi:hypothetical protein